MKKGEKKRDGKSVTKSFRFEIAVWNRIKGLAKIYSKGDVTQWVTHGALTGERRLLK